MVLYQYNQPILYHQHRHQWILYSRPQSLSLSPINTWCVYEDLYTFGHFLIHSISPGYLLQCFVSYAFTQDVSAIIIASFHGHGTGLTDSSGRNSSRSIALYCLTCGTVSSCSCTTRGIPMGIFMPQCPNHKTSQPSLYGWEFGAFEEERSSKRVCC